MTMPTQQSGASVHARDRIPSTHLRSLLEFLVAAFPAAHRPDHALSWPALSYDPSQQRLCLNTDGVLRRFLANKAMRAAFMYFLTTRDSCISKGCQAADHQDGGRLLDSDLAGVSQQVGHLKHSVAAELDRLEMTPNSVLVTNPATALANLAVTMRLKSIQGRQQATLVPMEFAPPSRSSTVREKGVARIISAREEIQGEDWLTRMAGSIIQVMARRDDEFDEVQQEVLLEDTTAGL